MSSPVLYVIAGPNGIGKTTSAFDIIPAATPIINSDEIAKQIRTAGIVSVNIQEYSNREAQLLLQRQLASQQDFAIETNLSDQETWKFLNGIQKEGYKLHLVFLTTDNLQLLHNRIEERRLRGEHYVRPDIVEERYYVGLKLLSHYFHTCDEVQLFDNSTSLVQVATKTSEELKLLLSQPPVWFTTYLGHLFTSKDSPVPIKNLTDIEEVRKRYNQNK